MKSRKSLRVVLGLILTMYPVAVSQSGDGHDHDGHDHSSPAEKQMDSQDHGGDEEGVIHLTLESQKLGRIKTMPIESRPFSRKIPVVGRVSQDPEETVYAAPKQNGIIKQCHAVLGASVRIDDLLCIVTGKDGKQLEVRSLVDGVIIAELAKAGDKAGPENPIFALADMTKIGVNFDVYETDAGHVALGQEVMVHTQSYSDKVFKGRIVFVSPRMNETSNTLRIKALIDNDGQTLKLGMNVQGQIFLRLGEGQYLTVPSAAIQTVENKTVVFIQSSPEEFEPKEIKIISQDSEDTAIEAGIKNGTTVVVEGAFILKSEMLESEMEHGHSH